jgi:hypothetical protein
MYSVLLHITHTFMEKDYKYQSENKPATSQQVDQKQ